MTSRVSLVKTGGCAGVLCFLPEAHILRCNRLDYTFACRQLLDLMYLCQVLISLSDPVVSLHRTKTAYKAKGDRSLTCKMVNADGRFGSPYGICLFYIPPLGSHWCVQPTDER